MDVSMDLTFGLIFGLCHLRLLSKVCDCDICGFLAVFVLTQGKEFIEVIISVMGLI